MDDKNRLNNGRFAHDLDNWTISGAAYSAGDGDEHYGVAVLSTGGDYIEQTFSVPKARSYTVHTAYKPTGGAPTGTSLQFIITDGDGNTVVTTSITGGTADSWNETTNKYGLVPGTTYTLRIINNDFGDDIKIDDVWLWFVPKTRAEIAAIVNRKLARLASNRSLSTTASGTQTEGDYTDAVDSGLRSVGAINEETGEVDIRCLDENLLQAAIDAVEREILEQLHRDYVTEVDITAGPQSRKLSQISQGVEAVLGLSRDKATGGAGGQVVTRKLIRESDDYDFN